MAKQYYQTEKDFADTANYINLVVTRRSLTEKQRKNEIPVVVSMLGYNIGHAMSRLRNQIGDCEGLIIFPESDYNKGH